MAWLNKRNGNYYYRSRREGDKVISEYVGTGYMAMLEAALDKMQQQQHYAERQAWQAVVDEQEAIDAELDNVSAAVADLVDAVLLVTGHRQHKREWRKQRERG